jgi:hypothetical protein
MVICFTVTAFDADHDKNFRVYEIEEQKVQLCSHRNAG